MLVKEGEKRETVPLFRGKRAPVRKVGRGRRMLTNLRGASGGAISFNGGKQKERGEGRHRFQKKREKKRGDTV